MIAPLQWFKNRFGAIHKAPIIFLGKEKSGTTVISSLFAQYTGKSYQLDIRPVWGAAELKLFHKKLKLEDFIKDNKSYFKKEVIKEPGLTYLYDQLRIFFQQAKFVMIVRDPRDNIRSIFNRLGLRGDLEQLTKKQFQDMPNNWKNVIDGKRYNLNGNDYIEDAALRWNLAVNNYLDYEDEMILCRYEDFMNNKVKCIEKLAEELHETGRNDISAYVDKQYQPSGDRNISWEEFFGDKNLQKIEKICSSKMIKLNYTPKMVTNGRKGK